MEIPQFARLYIRVIKDEYTRRLGDTETEDSVQTYLCVTKHSNVEPRVYSPHHKPGFSNIPQNPRCHKRRYLGAYIHNSGLKRRAMTIGSGFISATSKETISEET